MRHGYTPERITAMSTEDIRTLQNNARRLGADDVVAMCQEELQKRAPAKAKRVVGVNKGYVAGYHFVCAKDHGVTFESDGRFRSRSWVVAEENVANSLRNGAYIALHESRSLPSYRQGKIVGYEVVDRGLMGKDNTGIEFIVEADDLNREWVGDGTGEKGYLWSGALGSNEETEDKATSE
ncbi:hypothetical protein [Nitratireductor basaltis]|uniref:Uncharacterized protein n=1 Tax=Nitratireductor basaltis TaxID=472175 RepID=A0A084U675_9HYPH|nr:hypothetical protein [Nitratireductor basaltis]KFB08461.1 hypothetical protein EL18_02712 [Nitratireductor basaltis]